MASAVCQLLYSTTTHANKAGFTWLWHRSRVSLPTNHLNSLPRRFSEHKNVKNVTDVTLCFYSPDRDLFQCNHNILWPLKSKSCYSAMSKCQKKFLNLNAISLKSQIKLFSTDICFFPNCEVFALGRILKEDKPFVSLS